MDGQLIDILMEVQYRFPLVERPFLEIAERLDTTEEKVIDGLRQAARLGILKRIGAILNYKSRGMVAALVAMAVPEDIIENVARAVNEDPLVSHNFQRDYKPYNLWYVTKASGTEELEEKVRNIAERFGVDYIILHSLRSYKVDVRFDLHRGISWTRGYIMPENPPSVNSLGIPMAFFGKIKSIPLEPEPFRGAAEVLGLSTRRTIEKIRELIELGVLRELHGTLDGEAVGFRENAMVVLDTPRCEEIAMLNISTHVVLRNTVPGKWEYPCYFMVHGTGRDVIQKHIDAVQLGRHRVLYSVRDFLGGREMARRLERVAD